MAKGVYIGESGIAQKVKSIYIGVGGVARSVKKAYVGVGGVARLCYTTLDPVFTNNTWEQIIWACQTNSVPDTWAVGGSKTMLIDGVEQQIDIIGKNHDTYSNNSGTAPLTLQLHDYVEIDSWSLSKVDAMISLLPNYIADNIKNVDKTRWAGVSVGVIEESKKLFLLSEFEVVGAVENSYCQEGKQYPYYEDADNRKKAFSGSMYKGWWTRSYLGRDPSCVCYIAVNGASNYQGISARTIDASFAFCF